MDIAEDRVTGLGRASTVEQCQCPRGYKGLSCEVTNQRNALIAVSVH